MLLLRFFAFVTFVIYAHHCLQSYTTLQSNLVRTYKSTIMNSSPKRASNPSPLPDSGNISDTVTNDDLEILDASVGNMSIGPGGNRYPAEIQVKTNNLVEGSTVRVERKCTPEKIFKYLIFMGCLLFILVTVIILGLKHSGDTDTVKECLPGYYNFPECIRK